MTLTIIVRFIFQSVMLVPVVFTGLKNFWNSSIYKYILFYFSNENLGETWAAGSYCWLFPRGADFLWDSNNIGHGCGFPVSSSVTSGDFIILDLPKMGLIFIIYYILMHSFPFSSIHGEKLFRATLAVDVDVDVHIVVPVPLNVCPSQTVVRKLKKMRWSKM